MKGGFVLLVAGVVALAFFSGCTTQTEITAQNTTSLTGCWEYTKSPAEGIILQLHENGTGKMFKKFYTGTQPMLESFTVSWQKITDTVQVSLTKDKPEYHLTTEEANTYFNYIETKDVLCSPQEELTCLSRVPC
jgi:hypothetical protein